MAQKNCFANDDDYDDEMKYIINYGYQTEYIYVATEVCNFDISQNNLEFSI
jgi:hypothetical protein